MHWLIINMEGSKLLFFSSNFLRARELIFEIVWKLGHAFSKSYAISISDNKNGSVTYHISTWYRFCETLNSTTFATAPTTFHNSLSLCNIIRTWWHRRRRSENECVQKICCPPVLVWLFVTILKYLLEFCNCEFLRPVAVKIAVFWNRVRLVGWKSSCLSNEPAASFYKVNCESSSFTCNFNAFRPYWRHILQDR
jgi:hypothetical protein